ncbi:cytochrome c oxidase assembly factor 5-like [Hydractinia symbiolongicarpus]|uniref:cytochrome c oxidase assembly factor 5-like n=1 Tax=Hydractinia symbiolongicarpus TaxID=13093 RepID=UPI00254D4EC9|nr:cytochrome c oxidase assembly factor 5-like [Hydractinia symbiolongicarpus]
MSDLEEQEGTKEACSGLKAELISCLRKSDCMKKEGKALKECMAADANVDAECKQTQYSFFECRRSMLDMRNRFRGRKGY